MNDGLKSYRGETPILRFPVGWIHVWIGIRLSRNRNFSPLLERLPLAMMGGAHRWGFGRHLIRTLHCLERNLHTSFNQFHMVRLGKFLVP